ncbi:ATP-grasp domain-containing protein [Endozoicomonas ascidiicola]|uniref:ATP-grasp domain-containing protein n=1 Tax=Endozoicomonas ascidiicola TaxID=1698521 RepID=UPI0008368ED1|nr:ATP-grasp domain-containing protein [Endozoicomonas ascidiicola]
MTEFNILFAAAGRRVSLIRHFRKTLDELNISGTVYAADAGKSAPASFIADQRLQVPRVSSPDYIPQLISICETFKIRLLVSLIDTDLTLLSQHKDTFRTIGTEVLVCESATNNICFDKNNTWKFFTENSIDTPRVLSESDINKLKDSDFPLLIKPWDGSCSIGVNKVNSLEELTFFKHHVKNAIVQEYIQGDEYTCDAYVDFSGKVRCVVPRKRLETRAGEVSKGLTVNDPEIISAVTNVVEKLPHAVGCMTVQCFKQPDGRICFIEINPRFGGGHPLSLHAGADFPKWIIQELTGQPCEATQDCWQDDLAMLRYDDEIIVRGEDIR